MEEAEAVEEVGMEAEVVAPTAVEEAALAAEGAMEVDVVATTAVVAGTVTTEEAAAVLRPLSSPSLRALSTWTRAPPLSSLPLLQLHSSWPDPAGPAAPPAQAEQPSGP